MPMSKTAGFKILFFLILLFSFILRIYKIDTVYHLYDDEVSIGVNAYSILKTGHDEHGKLLPLWFKAFGEYKLPAYIYLTSLSELVFGKTELAVRLPSVLAGTLSVGLFMLICTNLKRSDKFSLLAGFLLSISPWHLQFSRGAFEANLALFFVLLGMYFFLNNLPISSTSKESWLLPSTGSGFSLPPSRCLNRLFFSVVFFILTLYTYNSYKIFTPLFAVSLLIIFRKNIIKLVQLDSFTPGVRQLADLVCLRRYLISISILFLLTLPVLNFSVSKEGLIRARSESFASEVKIKHEHFFQNLPFLQFEQFLKNYAGYFSLDFLFLTGDGNGRHSVREIGENYLWQIPFFLYGLYIAFKRKSRADKVFFSFLLLSPLGGAFSRPSPHALRGLVMVVPVTFFSTLGVNNFIKKPANTYNQRSKLKNQRIANSIVPSVLTLIAAFFLLQYLHIYYVHYPKRTAPDWTGGYKETVEFLSGVEEKYDKILLTDKFANSHVYLMFYGNYKPLGLLGRREPKEEMYTTGRKYKVVTSPYTKDLEEKTLYAAPSWEKRPEKIVRIIYNLSASEVFTIWEK